LLLFVFAQGSSALAQAPGNEADLSVPVVLERASVRNRLYAVARRFEIGAHVGVGLLPRLTEHFNFTASGAYNIVEWLAVEVRAGYAYSRPTLLAEDLQARFLRSSATQATDLTDNWALKANGLVAFRFQPIYGKMNLLSELPIHFQFSLSLGAGVGFLEQQSIVLCPNRQGNGCSAFLKSTRVAPVFGGAFGFRFWIPGLGDRHSLRLEVRDVSFVDSYIEGATRAEVNVDNPTGNGTLKTGGLTNVVQLDIGYAFIF
jgi:outer membrane beta-barrel protein